MKISIFVLVYLINFSVDGALIACPNLPGLPTASATTTTTSTPCPTTTTPCPTTTSTPCPPATPTCPPATSTSPATTATTPATTATTPATTATTPATTATTPATTATTLTPMTTTLATTNPCTPNNVGGPCSIFAIFGINIPDGQCYCEDADDCYCTSPLSPLCQPEQSNLACRFFFFINGTCKCPFTDPCQCIAIPGIS